MKATILCPGPSLAKYDNAPTDLTIGVNRAATRYACDVWSALDTPLVEATYKDVIGSPLLIASPTSLDTLRDHKVFWHGGEMPDTAMFDYCPHAMNYVMFSATTALVYAGYRGAKQITTWGADRTGTQDFDGKEAGKNRTPERWALESQLWANITDWLKERGVTVTKGING